MMRESGARFQTVKEPTKPQAVKEPAFAGTKTIRQTNTQKTSRNTVKKSTTHNTKKGRKK